MWQPVTPRRGIPPSLRRLGELREQRGDTAKAVEAYTKLLALWRRADPELQSIVESVRRDRTELGAPD
jgi:cytochrome c-type biogenesis protein CcmH/NrfG